MFVDESVGFDDLFLLPHTSGTTGQPKGVMFSHANATWNVLNVLTCADFRGDDVTIAIAPFFRVGGTGVNVLPGALRRRHRRHPRRCERRGYPRADRTASRNGRVRQPGLASMRSSDPSGGRQSICPASGSSSQAALRCPERLIRVLFRPRCHPAAGLRAVGGRPVGAAPRCRKFPPKDRVGRRAGLFTVDVRIVPRRWT